MTVLDPDGAVRVEGELAAGHEVDVDPPGRAEAFRVRVLDSSGDVLHEATHRSPVLVREFLAHYSDLAGLDVLDAFPQLGRFPVTVPELDGATTVEFALRTDEGDYLVAGSHDLGSVDDVGRSEQVVATETLVDRGETNRLDIVLVGDGYTADEQDLWHADAQALSDGLLAREPFASFADGINVHRVDAISAESGASFDCSGPPDECGLRDTAFGSIFAVELVNILLGSDYDARSVLQEHQWEVARAVSHVPWDLVVVVVNTDRSSGMTVHYATVTATDELVPVGVHEFAHLLGDLGDEYVQDDCIRSDALRLPVNVTEDPDDVPWTAWLGVDDVGAWPGAFNCPELYRPSEVCTMRGSSVGDFCPVCSEALVQRLFRFLDPVDEVALLSTDEGLSVEVRGPFEVELVLSGDGQQATGSSAAPPVLNATPDEVELEVRLIRSQLAEPHVETFRWVATD